MAKNTKKLSDRLREVIDTWLDALQGLVNPPPAPVPVRTRQSRFPMKHQR